MVSDFPEVTLILGGSSQKWRLVTLGLFVSDVLASPRLETSISSLPLSFVIQDHKFSREGLCLIHPCVSQTYHNIGHILSMQ